MNNSLFYLFTSIILSLVLIGCDINISVRPKGVATLRGEPDGVQAPVSLKKVDAEIFDNEDENNEGNPDEEDEYTPQAIADGFVPVLSEKKRLLCI